MAHASKRHKWCTHHAHSCNMQCELHTLFTHARNGTSGALMLAHVTSCTIDHSRKKQHMWRTHVHSCKEQYKWHTLFPHARSDTSGTLMLAHVPNSASGTLMLTRATSSASGARMLIHATSSASGTHYSADCPWWACITMVNARVLHSHEQARHDRKNVTYCSLVTYGSHHHHCCSYASLSLDTENTLVLTLTGTGTKRRYR
eukprot:scaffold59884_cov22-Tisochrysis_lutea.AAC.1